MADPISILHATCIARTPEGKTPCLTWVDVHYTCAILLDSQTDGEFERSRERLVCLGRLDDLPVVMERALELVGRTASRAAATVTPFLTALQVETRDPDASADGGPSLRFVKLALETLEKSGQNESATPRPTARKEGQERDSSPAVETAAPEGGVVERMSELRRGLRDVVYGQHTAIDRTILAVANHRIDSMTHRQGAKDENRPPLCLLYLGGSGVGKTLLARTLARKLGESEAGWGYQYVNAAHLDDRYAHHALLGHGPQYQGGAQTGALVSPLRKHQRCVFHFDEVHRGPTSAMNVLLDIIETGRVKDQSVATKTGPAPELDASESVFIFTTNAGRRLYEDPKTFGLYGDVASVPREVVAQELRLSSREESQQPTIPSFSAPFLDRMRDLIVFQRLPFSSLLRIAERELDSMAASMRKGLGVEETIVDQDVARIIVLGAGSRASARRIMTEVETRIRAEIMRALLDLKSRNEPTPSSIRVSAGARSFFEEVSTLGRHVLVVDDDVGWKDATVTAARVADADLDVTHAATPEDAWRIVTDPALQVDWILLDLYFDGEERGTRFLDKLRTERPDLHVHVFSVHVTSDHEPLLQRCMRSGGAAGWVAKEGAALGSQDDEEAAAAINRLGERLRQTASQVAFDRFARDMERRGRQVSYQPQMRIARESGEETSEFVLRLADVRATATVRTEDMKWFAVEHPSESFQDVIGLDRVRTELKAVSEILGGHRGRGAHRLVHPKGILLYGPPGTGKTLLGRALANEANCPFISIAGATFHRAYNGAALVRELFEMARRYRPIVIFIDEIDALGSRDHGLADVGVINAFLTELDGFVEFDGIVVGATNRKDALDPALLRSGRIGRHFLIDAPRDPDVRRRLLLHHVRPHRALWPDENGAIWDRLVRLTARLTPAQIRSLIEDATWLAQKEGHAIVDETVALTARDNILHGPERTTVVSDEEQRRIAYHEAGHAVACRALGKRFVQVTVVPRGGAAGFMEPAVDEIRRGRSREELLNDIVIALAGRESERKQFGQYYEGASQDLEYARFYALYMVREQGMTGDGTPLFASNDEQTAALSEAGHELLLEASGVARKKLDENWYKVEEMVNRLMEHHTLFDEDVAELWDG